MSTTMTEQEAVIAPLVSGDTCDATASGTEAAVVRVVNAASGRVLDLCAHHFAKHEIDLHLQGFALRHDDRNRLGSSYRGGE